MALVANALTTLAEAQAEVSGLSGAGTSVGERLIAVASDAIEAYCGRKFGRASRVERYAPPRGEELTLDVRPLDETVTPVILLDGTAVTGFVVDDPETATLHLDGGWGGESFERMYPGSVSGHRIPGSARRVLKVTYTAGWVLPKDATVDLVRTLPRPLEQACLDTVASLFRRRGVDRSAAAFDEAGALEAGGGIIPGPVRGYLAPYRRAI